MKQQTCEERFDERFGSHIGGLDEQVGKHSNYTYRSFLDFTRQEIASAVHEAILQTERKIYEELHSKEEPHE